MFSKLHVYSYLSQCGLNKTVFFVGKIKGGLGFKRTNKQKQFFIASPVNVIIVLHCRSYCDTKRENENLKKQTYGKGDDGDDGDFYSIAAEFKEKS